jgi:hypothetical protein
MTHPHPPGPQPTDKESSQLAQNDMSCTAGSESCVILSHNQGVNRKWGLG